NRRTFTRVRPCFPFEFLMANTSLRNLVVLNQLRQSQQLCAEAQLALGCSVQVYDKACSVAPKKPRHVWRCAESKHWCRCQTIRCQLASTRLVSEFPMLQSGSPAVTLTPEAATL